MDFPRKGGRTTDNKESCANFLKSAISGAGYLECYDLLSTSLLMRNLTYFGYRSIIAEKKHLPRG